MLRSKKLSIAVTSTIAFLLAAMFVWLRLIPVISVTSCGCKILYNYHVYDADLTVPLHPDTSRVTAAIRSDSLHSYIEVPWLGQPISVLVPRNAISQRNLCYLGSFSQLRRIQIEGEVQVEWLHPLLECPLIEELLVQVPSDADLDPLLAKVSKWPKLRVMTISGGQATDAGLNGLRSCSRLQWLSVSGARMSSVGVTALANMNNLKVISLGEHLHIADDDIQRLSAKTKNDVMIIARGSAYRKGKVQVLRR